MLGVLETMTQTLISSRNFYTGEVKSAKVTWPRSRDLLVNFGTPSISLERLKLQTSNLTC